MGSTGCQAVTAAVYVICLIAFVWSMVPTNQVVADDYPNVIAVWGSSGAPFEPMAHDNITLPEVSPDGLRGLYAHSHFFSHPTLERLVPYEEMGRCDFWKCAFWCSSPRNGADLMLMHRVHEAKKNAWWLFDVNDDANSPVIYARTKFRKNVSFNTTFVDAKPLEGKQRPAVIGTGDLTLYTMWHLFHFNSPTKIITVLAVVLAHVGFIWYIRRDDD